MRELARRPRLLLVCGRYEGVDDRLGAYLDEELSIGDLVLSGGEPVAVCPIDAIARLLPGEGLVEYPHYTRPLELRGAGVPDVLRSGNHERIRRWRRRQSLLRTRARRPDLFARLTLTDEDRALLATGEERGEES